jgi:hypothetical protein
MTLTGFQIPMDDEDPGILPVWSHIYLQCGNSTAWLLRMYVLTLL